MIIEIHHGPRNDLITISNGNKVVSIAMSKRHSGPDLFETMALFNKDNNLTARVFGKDYVSDIENDLEVDDLIKALNWIKNATIMHNGDGSVDYRIDAKKKARSVPEKITFASEVKRFEDKYEEYGDFQDGRFFRRLDYLEKKSLISAKQCQNWKDKWDDMISGIQFQARLPQLSRQHGKRIEAP